MNTDIQKSTRWFRRYFSLLSLGVIAATLYMIFFSDTSVLHKIEYQRIIDSLRTEVKINRDSMLYRPRSDGAGRPRTAQHETPRRRRFHLHM